MDLIWITTILSNIVVGCMGWALKTLYHELKDIRRTVQNTRENYVREEDLRGLKEDLASRFDRLENLLIDKLLKIKE